MSLPRGARPVCQAVALLLPSGFGSIVRIDGFGRFAPGDGSATRWCAENPQEQGEWSDPCEQKGEHTADNGRVGNRRKNDDVKPCDGDDIHAADSTRYRGPVKRACVTE